MEGLIGTYPLELEPYQFYDFGVIKKDDGFYVSTDSGCSCYIPWENHTEDDFIGPLTAEQVAEEYYSLARVDGQYAPLSEGEVENYLTELKEDMKNA